MMHQSITVHKICDRRGSQKSGPCACMSLLRMETNLKQEGFLTARLGGFVVSGV